MPPKHWRKKKDAVPHIGKLMIVLRNRHVVWIDMGPEDGKTMRAALQQTMRHTTIPATNILFDCAPFSEDTIRAEDIVHVRYIGPKSASTAPEATPES